MENGIKLITLPSGIVYGIDKQARHGKTDAELIELVAWNGRNSTPSTAKALEGFIEDVATGKPKSVSIGAGYLTTPNSGQKVDIALLRREMGLA